MRLNIYLRHKRFTWVNQITNLEFVNNVQSETFVVFQAHGYEVESHNNQCVIAEDYYPLLLNIPVINPTQKNKKSR